MTNLNFFLHRLKEAEITIDFILLCETFITDANAILYPIPGYRFIHKSRSSLTRGGVGMYIREHIKFTQRDDLAMFEEGEFESIIIETQSSTKNAIVGEIYRIPGTSERLSLDRYESLLIRLQNLN